MQMLECTCTKTDAPSNIYSIPPTTPNVMLQADYGHISPTATLANHHSNMRTHARCSKQSKAPCGSLA
jgi:hypothetical protein